MFVKFDGGQLPYVSGWKLNRITELLKERTASYSLQHLLEKGESFVEGGSHFSTGNLYSHKW